MIGIYAVSILSVVVAFWLLARIFFYIVVGEPIVELPSHRERPVAAGR